MDTLPLQGNVTVTNRLVTNRCVEAEKKGEHQYVVSVMETQQNVSVRKNERKVVWTKQYGVFAMCRALQSHSLMPRTITL